MAHTEIIVSTGEGGECFEHSHIDGEEAIHEGYQRFKQLTDQRKDWLVQASARRDFEDNLLVSIILKIGPKPFWSEDYLREHSLGKYAMRRNNG